MALLCMNIFLLETEILIRQSHRLGNEITRKDIKNIGKNGTFVPFSKVERKKEERSQWKMERMQSCRVASNSNWRRPNAIV